MLKKEKDFGILFTGELNHVTQILQCKQNTTANCKIEAIMYVDKYMVKKIILSSGLLQGISLSVIESSP